MQVQQINTDTSYNRQTGNSQSLHVQVQKLQILMCCNIAWQLYCG